MTLQRRPLLLSALGLGALGAAPLVQATSPAPKRIALFTQSRAVDYGQPMSRHRAALQRAGLVEGRDYIAGLFYGELDLSRLPEVAAKVAAWRPDVTISTIVPLRHLAPLLPQAGLLCMGLTEEHAATLRGLQGPGARVAGIDMIGPALNAKRLEMLAAMLPNGSSVLCMRQNATDAPEGGFDTIGQRLGLRLHVTQGRTPEDIDAAFGLAGRLKVQALNVLASQALDAQRAQFIARAARQRLPVMYEWSDAVADGGLISYGMHRNEFHDQIIRLAWRLMRPETVAGLPIERPMRVILAINDATAKAMQFKFPPALRARADEIFE